MRYTKYTTSSEHAACASRTNIISMPGSWTPSDRVMVMTPAMAAGNNAERAYVGGSPSPLAIRSAAVMTT